MGSIDKFKKFFRGIFRTALGFLLGRGRRFARLRARHLLLGARGESLSCRLLQELGMDILMRNYRNHHGEIDIVARDGAVLCFVEVKTRHRQRAGRPADAVNAERQERLVKCAGGYCRRVNRDVRLPRRFDIMEVVFDGSTLQSMNYLRAVFDE